MNEQPSKEQRLDPNRQWEADLETRMSETNASKASKVRIRRRAAHSRDGYYRYSAKISGNRGTYGRAASFDLTEGYLGINELENGKVTSRVLLSPQQIEALLKFLGESK